MCRFLKLPRATYYAILARLEKVHTNEYEQSVISSFKNSKNIYGARKIKKQLERDGIILSRRRIRRIMIKNSLFSAYTVLNYKPQKAGVNREAVENVVNQEFEGRKPLEVVVSDLTYVKVAGKWCYVCLLIDLYNKEILAYNVGKNKDSNLVYDTFMKLEKPLNKIQIFHTDRGTEFKNEKIDILLKENNIQRSLSKPGNPYDNSVAESMYKTLKKEFVKGQNFSNLEVLDLELFDYINWFNRIRLHGSLGYLSPKEYSQSVFI